MPNEATSHANCSSEKIFYDPYAGLYGHVVWILFWTGIYLLVQIGGNCLLIIMMSFEKYGLDMPLRKKSVANQLAYQTCAILVAGNVFALTFYVTRLLFGPLPHAFGFVAFGISICLCIAEMLYMIEHSFFRCLELFRWSLTPPSFDDLTSLTLGVFNFASGAIGALILVLSGQYTTNLLYLIYVNSKEPCTAADNDDDQHKTTAFTISFVAPAILLCVVNVICSIFAIVKKSQLKKAKTDNQSDDTQQALPTINQEEFLTITESQVFALNLTIFVALVISFQHQWTFNYHWFTAMAAFHHVPKSFFFPFLFFVSGEKRWAYLTKFSNQSTDLAFLVKQ